MREAIELIRSACRIQDVPLPTNMFGAVVARNRSEAQKYLGGTGISFSVKVPRGPYELDGSPRGFCIVVAPKGNEHHMFGDFCQSALFSGWHLFDGLTGADYLEPFRLMAKSKS